LLDGIGVLDAASARRIACDCKVIPAVLGSESEPLDIGRISYTVPTAIRRALILRDGGCAFPGCDRPHQWCHAHHIQHWADGGPTELGNLVLLCGRHHRLIHHSAWHCGIANGRPEFHPPHYIDTQQRPRRNTLHPRN
jgi:HNH endonuclease